MPTWKVTINAKDKDGRSGTASAVASGDSKQAAVDAVHRKAAAQGLKPGRVTGMKPVAPRR